MEAFSELAGYAKANHRVESESSFFLRVNNLGNLYKKRAVLKMTNFGLE